MAKQSSWREERISIGVSVTYEHRFSDTDPNYLVVTNGSGANVYVCLSPAVSAVTFDMIVPPFGRRMCARDLPFQKVYFYTDAPAGASLHLTSFVSDFNPSDIQQTQEITGTTATGLLGTIEVSALQQALPAGANVIGSVGISGFGASLPAGAEHIGAVLVDGLPSLPAGINNIGKVSALLDLNEDIAVFQSAARTATSSVAVVNKNFRGAKIVIDVTDVQGASAITVKAQGKDSVSGKTFDILESVAINAVGTTVLTVHPGVAELANVKVSDVLPRNVVVTVTHTNGDSITYSVAALMMV